MPEKLKKIFISYARKDGRKLALRLKKDLQKRDFTVWLDTSEIVGGVNWAVAIEGAIENCDVAIALLSHASYLSNICRAEQIMSLDKGKRVIPLLVQADAEKKRPLVLYHRHYLDFTRDSMYSTSFEQLIAAINDDSDVPKVERKTYTNAPEIRKFIERPNEIAKLRERLISDNDERCIALTALHGMGGIGKSALAARICRDEIVQAAFPSGVIWVDVGRENVSKLNLIKIVGRELGYPMEHYTSDTEALRQLRKTLLTESVLIVLDDVWDIEHARLFSNIEAPRSRVLFTTRRGSIGDSIGASEVRLDVLESQQALDLLQQWAERDLPEMPQVAKKLGYLPLALEIAGGRLRKTKGEDWLKAFSEKEISFLKKQLHSNGKYNSVEISFDLSVELLSSEEQLHYHSLGIFPEDLWIPETAVFKLWQNYQPNLSEIDCREIAYSLNDLALMKRREDGAILLHDLLHDYNRVRIQERDEYQNTHQKLLHAYKPDETQTWWEIVPDGYIYENLAYHLTELQRHEDLHQLLTASPDWMEAKFIHCMGDSGYVADLEIAMKPYKDPLSTEDLVKWVQLNTAHQLIMSRNYQYDNNMLVTLSVLDRVDEALNHASLRISKQNIFDGLLCIYREAYKENPSNKVLELITLGKEIKADHPFLNLQMIFWSFPSMTDDVGCKLIEEIMVAIESEEEEFIQHFLPDIAQTIAKYDLERGLFIAKNIVDSEHKEKALAGIVGVIAQNDFQKALQITNTLTSYNDSAIRNIIENIFSINSDQALKLVDSINSKGQRSEILSWLAVQLASTNMKRAKDLFAEAAQLAQSIENNVGSYVKRNTLCQLAMDCCYIDTSMTIHFIEENKFYVWKTSVLKTLAVVLIPVNIDEAIRFAHLIKDAEDHTNINRNLRDFAAEIGKIDLNIALEFAEMIDEESRQKIAWHSIIREVAKTDLSTANQLFKEKIENIPYKIDEASFHEALLEIVKNIVSVSSEKALRLIELISDLELRDKALKFIVKEIAKSNSTRASELASTINDNRQRDEANADVIAELLKFNSSHLKMQLELVDWYSKDNALVYLAEQVSIFNLDLALEIVELIVSYSQTRTRDYKNQAYNAIIQSIVQDKLEVAVEILGKIKHGLSHNYALQAVATELSKKDISKSLELCDLIEYQEVKACTLIGISNEVAKIDPILSKKLFDQAMSLALIDIEENNKDLDYPHKEEILIGIVQEIAKRDSKKAIKIINTIKASNIKIDAIQFAISNIAKLDADTAVSLAHSIVSPYGGNEDKEVKALMDIARTISWQGDFTKALSILRLHDTGDHLKLLATLQVAIQKHYGENPLLWLKVMHKALQILCWTYPSWIENRDIFLELEKQHQDNHF